MGDGGEGGSDETAGKIRSTGCIYPCVRDKWDGTSPEHLRVLRVNIYVKGISRRLLTATKYIFLTN